ncbi:MAG: hypothetical protein QF371_03800, partial [Flavobacteriales bacterium]|nr:hypothetical protein [Flavobacteriales bacterium]
GEFKGFQMGALVNYAKKMRGIQFGLVNVTDTLKGIAFGLINVSKNGYMRVEIQGSDLLHTSVRFKSGTRSFYTVFQGGVRWKPLGSAYGGGFGLGSRIDLTKRFFSEFEIDNVYVREHNGNGPFLGILVRTTPSIGIRIVGPLEFHVGPTLTYHYANSRFSANGNISSELGLSPFYRSVSTSQLHQIWVGVKGGIQFDLNWKKPKK